MKQSDNKQDRHYSQEDIEKLSQRMDEDIEEMLHTSESVKPHEFSEEYEARLARSLKEHFGEEKAEAILKKRNETRESAGAKAPKHHSPFSLKSCKNLSGQSLKEKISHFPFSGLVQMAAAILIVVVVAGIFGKNEAKASWWENIEFIIRAYEEYSQIEAYDEVDETNITYPKTIEKKYIPTKVAEGYEEVVREEVSKENVIIYENQEGLQYMYTQQTKDVGNHIDTENIEYRECDTMFGKGYYTEKNNYCKVVWDYEKYIFIMEGNLSKDTLIDFINSIQLERGSENAKS